MLGIGQGFSGIHWPMSVGQHALLERWKKEVENGEFMKAGLYGFALQHGEIIGRATGTGMKWNWEKFSLEFPLDGSSSVWYDFTRRAWTDHNPTASKTVAALAFLCWLVNVYLYEALVSKLDVM